MRRILVYAGLSGSLEYREIARKSGLSFASFPKNCISQLNNSAFRAFSALFCVNADKTACFLLKKDFCDFYANFGLKSIIFSKIA